MAVGNQPKWLKTGVVCLVVICFIVTTFIVLKILIKDDGGRRRRQIQRVTLVKPPPPPKPKEKPPEPEVKKKDEVIEPEPEDLPPEDMEDMGEDEAPPGEDLGLDAEGSGSGDGFGLQGKKGGSPITRLGGGKNLLKRYSWYTRILQEEIRDKVNKLLEKIDNLPEGSHRMMLRLKLDQEGNVVFFSVYKSSGSATVDEVVEQALAGFKISEAPPDKMPKTMRIKVTFKS